MQSRPSLPEKDCVGTTSKHLRVVHTDGWRSPSIGIKRADALLTDKGCTWETIVKHFASNLGEDVALYQTSKNLTSRKLCQQRNPTLKIPSASDRVDDGAGLQAEGLELLLAEATKEDIITVFGNSATCRLHSW